MLQKILDAASRLDGIAHKTPVFTSTQLDTLTNAEIFIKAENLQRGGAFKFRGAYNTISQLPADQKVVGVITHSSGNHAQAVAISGKLLGIPATIVMPNNAPIVKIQATKGYGAEVVLCEPTQQAREATVNHLIEEKGYHLVHPYDNFNIIAGAATASKELHEEIPDLDYIVAPVGGGGLISGTALYTKLSKLDCHVVAAEPRGANDAFRSFKAKKRVKEQVVNTISDGLRTTLSQRTFSFVTNYVDDIICVSDNQTIEAMKFLFERMKLVVEPSGAVPVASAIVDKRFSGKKVGIIISGGNVDLTQYFKNLQPLDTV